MRPLGGFTCRLQVKSIQLPVLTGLAERGGSVHHRRTGFRPHAVDPQRFSPGPWCQRALDSAHDMRNCHGHHSGLPHNGRPHNPAMHRQSRTLVCRALGRDATWTSSLSPYETLGKRSKAFLSFMAGGYVLHCLCSASIGGKHLTRQSMESALRSLRCPCWPAWTPSPTTRAQTGELS